MKLIDPIFNRTKTGFITINHHKILFSMKHAQNVVSREDMKWENDACWWNVQGSGKCGKKQPSGIKSSTVTRFSMEISLFCYTRICILRWQTQNHTFMSPLGRSWRKFPSSFL